MVTANSAPRHTTEGFANDNSEFDGLMNYDNFKWVLRLAMAEVSMWRRAAILHKSKPTHPTIVTR